MNTPSAPHFTRQELRVLLKDLHRIPTDENASARAKLRDWAIYDNDPQTKAFSEPAK